MLGRLLIVSWTARRSNPLILKEINSECSFGRTDAEAESGHLIQRATHNFSQMLGKTEVKRRKG